MKKINLVLAIALSVYGCAPKNVPANAVKNEKNNTASPVIVESSVPPNPAVPPIAPAVDKTSAEYLANGKKLFETRCNKCHALKLPADYTQQRWVNIVDWMGNKAKLTSEEKENILAYVQHNAQDAPQGK